MFIPTMFLIVVEVIIPRYFVRSFPGCAAGQRKRRARESDQDIEMGETGDDNQIVQYFPHSTPLDGDFAEDLVSLIDNLADSAAHRRLRDSQPEAGRDVDGAEQVCS